MKTFLKQKLIFGQIKLFVIIAFFWISVGKIVASAVSSDTIDLSGIWRFQLDPMDFGKTPGSELSLTRLNDSICLPGSTDQGEKGIKNTAQHVDRLSRKYEYCGAAWYQRDLLIPEEWEGNRIILKLERCHWETTVYVDGVLIGFDERLSTPNRFDLSDHLKPGEHTITICVDNRIKYPMDNWTHGLTEYTQTNWNGIVGDIQLIAYPSTGIESIQVYPSVKDKKINVKTCLNGTPNSGNISFIINDIEGNEVNKINRKFLMDSDSLEMRIDIPFLGSVDLWDEFNPTLYTLNVEITDDNGKFVDRRIEKFGMREVEKGKHHIKINGIERHLRGVLDCCVFPLTGYPSTHLDEWKRIFSTVKEYGFNHVRFHSWCPPEAAFDAADELGLYLQVELPMWIKDVGKYPSRRNFFEKEMYALLDEYGNHPSFVLYCNGNENEGDFSVLEDLVIKGQNHDPRHLYSASTARSHVAADQFYTSHVSPKGWITVYEGKPSTDWDLNLESDIDVPVIAHETGQRCMYPNFSEMSKYTGVLEPRNMRIFQQRLEDNGMLNQAEDFLKSTGEHTILQYKEVNEALLRTSNSGGYQLLGLQDFPGQGSAYVGLLDAFWESKGLISPEKYREFNDNLVVLARFPARIYSLSDTLKAKIDVYNFSPSDLEKGEARWQFVDSNGKEVANGKISHRMIKRSTVDSLFLLDIPLADFETPNKFTLKVELATGNKNEWDFWIYPNEEIITKPFLTNKWEDARKRLENGEKVFFIPNSQEGRKTRFAGHFWNPIMFNWDPMIVGTLIDKNNGAFSSFPTDIYADWQWTDILNNTRAVDLTAFRSLTPVIQSVDTYEVNRKLGIAFEAVTPENGKLFVLFMDLQKDMDSRPASKRLINSINEYVDSDGFKPKEIISLTQLDELFNSSNSEKYQVEKSDVINQLLNQ